MTRRHSTSAAGLLLSELERAVVQRDSNHVIATGIRAAQRHGIPVTQTALASGLTRTRLYSLVERDGDLVARIPRRSLGRLVAAFLDLQVPLGLVDHAHALQVPVDQAREVLADLCARDVAEALVRTAERPDGPVAEVWFGPGPRHAEWVSSELDALRWVRQERFSVYIELPPGSRGRVAPVVHRLGPDLATVIAAGTASLITWDELAVGVGGQDSREALDTAADLWRDIWDKHLREAIPPMLVREVLPPS